MLKSRTGNDQSVQTVTWAICGRRLTLVIVKSVSCVRLVKSTSKYGRSRVAAGATPMSHESSLLVVVGPAATPGSPNWKVASGAGVRCRFTANAEPAIRRVAIMARTKSFFMLFSYTLNDCLEPWLRNAVTLSRRYDHLPRRI